MAKQSTNKAAKGSKAGRSKEKMAKRKANKTTEKNKVVKIYHSEGKTAALAYASKHAITAYLLKRFPEVA